VLSPMWISGSWRIIRLVLTFVVAAGGLPGSVRRARLALHTRAFPGASQDAACACRCNTAATRLALVDPDAAPDNRDLVVVQEPHELRSLAVVLGRYTVFLPGLEDPQPFMSLGSALGRSTGQCGRRQISCWESGYRGRPGQCTPSISNYLHSFTTTLRCPGVAAGGPHMGHKPRALTAAGGHSRALSLAGQEERCSWQPVFCTPDL
jgi:hypothetical protein